MSDLIDRQTAIDGVIKSCLGQANVVQAEAAAIQYIKRIPSAEPERGKWIDMGDFESCSSCNGTHLKEFQTFYGKTIWVKTPYCPYCGAKMDEEQDNETVDK